MNTSLITVSVTAVIVALIVANNIMTEFVQSITYIDLAAIFILGLVAGFTSGLVFGRYKSGKTIAE
ncbi:MAG TPA: hypothetical protein VKA34_22635 [Balneolales bacterium]|nr:hypothetical protein [Balneolales bacterium]